jgi:hypothetical protein
MRTSDTEQGQPTRQTGKKKRVLARKPKQRAQTLKKKSLKLLSVEH